MKNLLFGTKGQVDWELQRRFQTFGVLTALDADNQDYFTDFTSLGGISESISSIAPDVMALVAKRIGARKIHCSTNYVFNGSCNKTKGYFRPYPALLTIWCTSLVNRNS